MSEKRTYTVVLEPEEEGGFTVRVPSLPEIVTYGKDEREALAMAEDAIRLVIEDCTARGEPVPNGGPPRIREGHGYARRMSQRLPSLKAREVIRALERAGFQVSRTSGSHCRLIHMTDPARKITIPVHSGDSNAEPCVASSRRRGSTTAEFLELL